MGEEYKNSLLLDEEDMQDVMKEDLSDAIKHGLLVSKLASSIACVLGESEEFIESVALAGMVHDIGKLKLSKYLYGRKKDVLVVEEMKYVRLHSTYSYEIVKREGFSEEIQQMVYHHHENYDGSGYPDNLKGTAIPWGARILRTCDVFAALVSKRPYRDAFDVDTALELMIDEVKNFDMRVFLAFQRVVNDCNAEELRTLIERVNNKDADERWIQLYEEEFKEERK
ncbi:HD-GYP domain-containing protein [Velocimicrobium porci]|uniref:HD domain-containing protein n=1 Tax=Velocimicrobium porci TaxID=2606634 RepID=A0A6L5XXU3_9FIRM|nr:HD domain-containing phosphohydrolase [Velocimicrobium porci]MSS63429.1 HD domain-containing protein [Velocimicrobium porci]